MEKITKLRAYPGWTVTETGATLPFNACNADGTVFLCGAKTFLEAVAFVREQVRGKRPEENPWKAQQIEREYAYCGSGYSRAMARRAVEWEFAGAPDPIDCACGRRAFYRATVGAMKCPSCDALYTVNGERI